MRNRGLLSKTFCTPFNQLTTLTYSAVVAAGMGLLVLVLPPLKSLLKGPPPSLQGIPPIWSAGLFQKASSPTVTCVQTSSHRLERPTILQYSDFRRELLESTEEGSCSSLQKKGKLLTASQAKTWCQRNKTGCHAPKTSLS